MYSTNFLLEPSEGGCIVSFNSLYGQNVFQVSEKLDAMITVDFDNRDTSSDCEKMALYDFWGL